MFVSGAERRPRQGTASTLAAGALIFGQVLSSALASAEDASSLVTIGSAPSVVDATRGTTHVGALTREPMQDGNPVWSLPLTSLSVTRERPIFSPSRRPPPPPAVAAPYVPPPSPPRPPSKPAGPDHPSLTLVGTVAGDGQGVGIFVSEAEKSTLRLRTGEDYQGWILRSIRAGEVVFEKDERTATLALTPLGSAAQAVVPPIPLGNTWRDGDGQMISAPPRRDPKPAPAPAAPPRGPWLDGDGQMISRPAIGPSSPPAIAPTAVEPAL
jgi:hypothetical protein